ncbi:Protein kinase protein rad53 [Neonectria magnoliae]|uniref:Autophagy-related protein 1 n=1 Tax=Neonectria magnoliae TaxID=2732573 RepID=A0ABR1HZZ2_9HYPO
MDGEEPTQATQNVLDPRRVGKQNSGFSDEDISDIICVLYPHSDPARLELERLVREDNPHIIGKDEADTVEPDYALEDDARHFQANPVSSGNYAVILRLSTQLKNPAAGFAFGRNPARCDVVFVNDPLKRVSNIHFRIYVNEYGTVMIEDQSTNGTIVDNHMLASHPNAKVKTDPPTSKWVLSSGAVIRICLHQERSDLAFRVRIPLRDDVYGLAYNTKVEDFFTRHGLRRQNEIITAGPGGHVDLFKPPAQAPLRRAESNETTRAQTRSPSKRRETPQTLCREWTGSGKYNRTGTIGKGAFAVVHKVTSKYSGLPYAAKELEKRRFIKNGVLDQKVENEMKIMQRVEHPNVVRYIEHFEWDDRLLIIIMEFIPGGDLGKFISDQGVLSEDVVRVMSQQLLGALGYLHSLNITHRDVKPDNILINSLDPIDVKLTDFGLSKMVDSEQTFLRTFCGTLLYCAPEVYTEYAEYDDDGIRSRGKKIRRILGQRYNHAVDIWSLGGVLFYTMTGSPPYPVKGGISYSELLHKIMTSRLNITPLQQYGVSEKAIDFLCSMLQKRPENRATVPKLNSHPWLDPRSSIIEASQSFDEITDDEDMAGNFSQLQHHHYEEDRVSDSMGEDSEKENSFGQQPPRLFGEVGISAIGSSGVIPEDFLNLQTSNPSMGETEILGDDVDEAYQSDDSATPKGRRAIARQTTISIAQNQSADQLQSLVEDVASQSLGGNESVVQNLAPSANSLQSAEFNTSKRRPRSLDTSDEYDENTPPGKPNMKRLKSEGNMDILCNESIEEYKLLARMPQIRKQGTRVIDGPYDKSMFWQQDRSTWHLDYPEMTQLQHDAFALAARERNEEFFPGKSPLWDLALKHFPPLPKGQSRDGLARLSREPSKVEEHNMMDGPTEFPPTAAPIEYDQIPDTLAPNAHIVVPIQADTHNKRAVGIFESHPDSSIEEISFPVTDSLVSFGRGPENTEVFEPRTESRVPKYAFKLLLWKDGDTYDPSKDPSKVPPPWHGDCTDDPNSYGFYISTKATLGIRINDYVLPSSESKNNGGPARYWTRVYNGDTLLIWGTPEPRNQTKLTFRCFWGASSHSRDDDRAFQVAPPALAQKLDAACQKTEKRIKEVAEKQKKYDGVAIEHQVRKRFVERERERSRVFEMKRLEAVNYLLSRQIQPSRRASPASAPPTAYGRTLTTQLSRMSPDKEAGFAAR